MSIGNELRKVPSSSFFHAHYYIDKISILCNRNTLDIFIDPSTTRKSNSVKLKAISNDCIKEFAIMSSFRGLK